MRGTRSLGLALIAATLGAAPALAQQSTSAPPSSAPAANTSPANTSTSNTSASNAPAAANPSPAANSGSDKTAAGSNTDTTTHSSDKSAAANPAPGAGPAAAPTSSTAASTAPSSTTAANTSNSGPSGSLQKYNDSWRAGKLVGATVYNSKGDSVGTIDDLLMGDDGKITQVVISTGGLLGIGGKLVSVPYDQIKLEPSAGNGSNAGTTTAANNAPAGGNAPAASNAPAAAGTSAAKPVYYSVVLPDATKDSPTSSRASNTPARTDGVFRGSPDLSRDAGEVAACQ